MSYLLITYSYENIIYLGWKKLHSFAAVPEKGQLSNKFKFPIFPKVAKHPQLNSPAKFIYCSSRIRSKNHTFCRRKQGPNGQENLCGLSTSRLSSTPWFLTVHDFTLMIVRLPYTSHFQLLICVRVVLHDFNGEEVSMEKKYQWRRSINGEEVSIGMNNRNGYTSN